MKIAATVCDSTFGNIFAKSFAASLANGRNLSNASIMSTTLLAPKQQTLRKTEDRLRKYGFRVYARERMVEITGMA